MGAAAPAETEFICRIAGGGGALRIRKTGNGCVDNSEEEYNFRGRMSVKYRRSKHGIFAKQNARAMKSSRLARRERRSIG